MAKRWVNDNTYGTGGYYVDDETGNLYDSSGNQINAPGYVSPSGGAGGRPPGGVLQLGGQWYNSDADPIDVNGNVIGKTPSAPTTRTVNGVTYEWDGSAWVPSSSLPQQVTNVNVAAPVTWGPSQTDDDGHVTGVPGAVYQVNSRGDVSILNKPGKPGASLYNDANGDGYDDQTGLPNGVIRDSNSPSGYLYQGKPVNPDGSLYTGGPKLSGAGPDMQTFPDGSLRQWDPKSRTWVIVGTKPQTLPIPGGGGGGGSYGGGGGGFSAPARDYAGEQAAGDAAEFERLKYELGFTGEQNALTRAQTEARDAARATIDRAQLRLELGKGLQGAVSSTDPAAYAAFQLATGGGIWGGLKGGLSALSQRALQPGAEMLGALRDLDSGPSPEGATAPVSATPGAATGGGLSAAASTAPPVGPVVPSLDEDAGREGSRGTGSAGPQGWGAAEVPVDVAKLRQDKANAVLANLVYGLGGNDVNVGEAIQTMQDPSINPALYAELNRAYSQPVTSLPFTPGLPAPRPGNPGLAITDPNYYTGVPTSPAAPVMPPPGAPAPSPTGINPQTGLPYTTNPVVAPKPTGINPQTGLSYMARGGVTRAPMFLGNERGREMFINRTGAPIEVVPHGQTERMMDRGGLSRMPGYQEGTYTGSDPYAFMSDYFSNPLNMLNLASSPVPVQTATAPAYTAPYTAPATTTTDEEMPRIETTATAPTPVSTATAPSTPQQPAWTAPELAAPVPAQPGYVPSAGAGVPINYTLPPTTGRPPPVEINPQNTYALPGTPGYVPPVSTKDEGPLLGWNSPGNGIGEIAGTSVFPVGGSTGGGNIPIEHAGFDPFKGFVPSVSPTGIPSFGPPASGGGGVGIGGTPIMATSQTGGGLSSPALAGPTSAVGHGFGSPDTLPPPAPIEGLSGLEQEIYNTRTGVSLPPLSYLMANYFSLDPVLRDYYERGMQDKYGIPAESIRFAARKFAPVGLSGRPRIQWAA